MNAGILDRTLSIYKTVNTGLDSAGRDIFQDQLIARVRCNVVFVSANEIVNDQRLINTDTKRFRIRYNRMIDTSCVIEFEDTRYNVIHLAEIGRKEGHMLTCRRIENGTER